MIFQGKLFKVTHDVFVRLINCNLNQKVYPISKLHNVKFLSSDDSSIVEVQLIPQIDGEIVARINSNTVCLN
jgi:hypothetical protein